MTDPAGAAIEVRGVSKWFGDVVAVSEVSVSVGPGITGLLGPNGAGKTTLLRMISGLAAPSEGEVRVLGEPVRDNPAIYRRLGIMTEHQAVYGFLTGRAFVELAADLHGLADRDAMVDRAIAVVGMEEAQGRRLGGYSRGMRQRMRLAAAIVNDPEVVILDEPLSGTDPRQRMELSEVLTEMAEAGRTIVVSSHILEEVETIAGGIVLMVDGKLAASGDYRAIRARLNERPYKVSVGCSDPRGLASALVTMDGVDSVEVGAEGRLVVLSSSAAALQMAVPRLAAERGIRLERIEPLDDSLESVFGYLVSR